MRKCEIAQDKLPQGAVLHDFLTWQVQEVKVDVRVIEIQRARYRLPDGSYLIADIPKEFMGSHFGPELRAYIVNLSQNGRMTQNKIFEHIQALGIKISEGQIDNILSNAAEDLRSEYEEVHQVGLQAAQFIQTDMTGGRHCGKNVHTLVLNNAHFTIFVTLDSKSRIAIFKALQGARPGYLFNESAIDYLKFKLKTNQRELEQSLILVQMCMNISCTTQTELLAALEERNVTHITNSKNLLKNLEEAALMGHLVEGVIGKNLVLVSDGAPEFAFLLLHQLCRIHAVRIFEKLIPPSQKEAKELDLFLDDLWKFYHEFKAYQNKEKLLLALELPFVPLHNNASENDIRTVVIKRKISGGTRSESGRKAGDIFASLYKTCKKQKISFFSFLKDRFSSTNHIPYLPELIKAPSPSPPIS